MDGLLLINKEKNMTSRDVVNILSKELNTKKIGHTGTLDPNATGVLAIAIGKCLKIVDEITALDKEYEATITLGYETDTLDDTGIIINKKEINVTEEEVDKVLESFIGKYEMQVPKYSAIKVNGKKLYEYARENIDVELPVKEVFIYELKRTSDVINNRFNIKCKVSKGTYIRSLIRDIGYKLNNYATMSELNRIKQGKFDIKDSYTLDDVKNGNYKLLTMKEVIDVPIIEIDDEMYKKVRNGMKIYNEYDSEKIAFSFNDKVIAIYYKDKDIYRAKKVFVD